MNQLSEQLKYDIIKMVATCVETGHHPYETFEDFKRDFPKNSKAAWEYYLELRNLGPAGFYEAFEGMYDFDPMFIEEYGTDISDR